MGTIGSRIRSERKAKKLTIQALADRVGLSKSTLTELELGESTSSTKLHRIATELGVSVQWLETGHGPKKAEGLSANAEPSHSRDLRQSRPERPDPAMLAAAYQWALIGIGLHDQGRKFSPVFAADAAIVSDVFALIAANGGSPPGGETSLELEAVIRRHAQPKGVASGRDQAKPHRGTGKRGAGNGRSE